MKTMLPIRIGCSVLAVLTPSAVTFAQNTTLVSVDSAGGQGNEHSFNAAISTDGRYVTFSGDASNLVPGDTNGSEDVFVHDRLTGVTSLVSVTPTGAPGNSYSDRPCISADGRFIAFASFATDLVPGDSNNDYDVFVRDHQAQRTDLISVSSSGIQGNRASSFPSVSSDGRFVAFSSWSSTLVSGSWNGHEGVFLRDRQTGQTIRVSVDSGGVQANDDSEWPSISGDGRYVAFESWASNLAPGDVNSCSDIFVHDRVTGQTTMPCSGNGNSSRPSISQDGRFLSFHSLADDLVPNDTNGSLDVFLCDLQTGATSRISVDSAGNQALGDSGFPCTSADGRFIAFDSMAANLSAGDTNAAKDVFVHDSLTGQTTRCSVDSVGRQGTLGGGDPSVSGDGFLVAFESLSNDLVPGDANGYADVFVNDRAPAFQLVETGSCPGPLTFTVSGAAPRGSVAFIWGVNGSFTIPAGRPCAGTTLDLLPLMAPPPGFLLSTATTAGIASGVGTAPPSACGRILMQALDLSSCRTSNVLVL